MPPAPPVSRTEAVARHAAAFLGFAIPISVALDNTLLALIAVLWFAAGNLKTRIVELLSNRIALSAVALFVMLAAGLLYGSRDPGDGLRYFGKYWDLLFIPLLITLFRDARVRELALRWFCAAMVLTFVVAELRLLGLLVDNPILPRGLGFTGGAFKLSITHGLLSAYATFLFVLLAREQKGWPLKLLYAALALVAVKNAAFIAISRTAYLVLAALAIYLAYAWHGRRGLVAAGLLLAVLAVAGYGLSPSFRERVDTIVTDAGQQHSQWPSRESVTYRLDWYRHSLAIVRDHPILGAGTGSFPHEYAKRAQAAGSPPTVNPHNEYLLIAVQTGLIGLALMLNLFWQQLRYAGQLASPTETHLARGLVITMAVGCLFNSFLLDHTEGLMFAWFTGLLFGGLATPVTPAVPRHAA